ncbi:MAG TPA: hypothetical protein VKA67_13795, partial [Verrucomicrobiae bacterium]|nr:hypothetical protein [Verrucomicrobiae bacterium]
MMAADHSLDGVKHFVRIWTVGFRLCLAAVIGLTIWRVFLGRKAWWTFAGRNRDRSGDLQVLAAKLKFDSFQPNRDEGFLMGWGFLTRLSQGGDRYAFNILQGKYHDDRLFVFDYHYQLGSGDNKEICYGTMLMLGANQVFPKVTITPE